MAIVLDGTAGITTPDLTDTSLTSGRVVYAGTSGNLTGSSAFTFDGANVIVNATTPAYFTGTSNLLSLAINRSPSTGTIFNASQSAALMNIDGDSGGSSFQFSTASAANTQPSEKMRLTGAGSLCVGSTSAGNAGTINVSVGSPGVTAGGLQLWATTTQTHVIQWGDGSTGSDQYRGYIEYAHNGDSMRFGTAATERARIDSSGNFMVGTTSAYLSSVITCSTSGASGISSTQTSAGGYCYRSNALSNGGTYYFSVFSANGTDVGSITSNGTTTTYATSSDYRLKNTIAPMTGALAKVAQLKPCTYKWNVDGSDGEGFIAHELAEVCPSAVTGAKDALDANGNIKPQGIDVSFLVATLTAAIQEQQALITTLTERITALEGA